MAERILHGLLQKACLDASAYCIKPASDWGFNVWKFYEGIGWACLKQLPNRGAAEEWTCDQVKAGAEGPEGPRRTAFE